MSRVGASNGRPTRTQRGVALIMVLWVVVLLTSMAAAVLQTQRTGISLARNALDAAEGRALVEAGLNYAVHRLLADRGAVGRTADDPDEPAPGAWAPDGEPRAWRFGGRSLLVTVRPEAALVDLNAADQALLQALFDRAGAAAGGAPPGLGAAVLDWRDEDGQRRPGGAERADYLAAGLPYGPANRPFDDVSELRLVLGMSDALFDEVRRALTVETGASRPELALAPLLVREAAAVAGQPGVDNEAEQVAGLVRAFARRLANAGIAFGGSQRGADAARNALRIRVEVALGEGARYLGIATVAPDPVGAGLSVIRWHTLGFVPDEPG